MNSRLVTPEVLAPLVALCFFIKQKEWGFHPANRIKKFVLRYGALLHAMERRRKGNQIRPRCDVYILFFVLGQFHNSREYQEKKRFPKIFFPQ